MITFIIALIVVILALFFGQKGGLKVATRRQDQAPRPGRRTSKKKTVRFNETRRERVYDRYTGEILIPEQTGRV